MESRMVIASGPVGVLTLWLHIWAHSDLLGPLSSPQTHSALPLSPFIPQSVTLRNWLPISLEPPFPTFLPGCTASTHLDLGSLLHSKPSILPPLVWLALFCCNIIPVVTRDQDHRLSVNLWAERAEKGTASNVNYFIKHRFNLYQLLWNWFSYWEYQKLIFFSKGRLLVCEIDMCFRIERGLLMR